jgi:S-adenosylmethionine:tRNA ribosyltransferase-isomerase
VIAAEAHRAVLAIPVDALSGEPRGDPAIPAVLPDGAWTLRADEVPRHAIRLVALDPTSDAAPTLEPFAALPRLLRAGDLVVVNDAATLPASLRGATAAGDGFELRLSGPVEAGRLFGVLLGAGDHRTRTEHRPPPPVIVRGDRVTVAGIEATVASSAGRRVELVMRADEDALWQALYAAGAPVQYAHRRERLPLWSVQTAYAGRPWAAEMPSAGRPLTWDVMLGLRRAGVALASLTHAAGLSSTGDDALDRALPWPERYEIPRRTIDAIEDTRSRGGRVIAVGTSVVRALESAVQGSAAAEPRPRDGIAAAGRGPAIRTGSGIARLRLDGSYRPRIVSGLVSGLHVPGESHFELLQAFASPDRLRRALVLAAEHGLSSHELGDACLIVSP